MKNSTCHRLGCNGSAERGVRDRSGEVLASDATTLSTYPTSLQLG
jgi:hypothetical protein